MVSGLFSSSYRTTHSIHQLHLMFQNSAETPLRATSGQKDVKNRFLANCHVDDGGGDDEEEDEDKC